MYLLKLDKLLPGDIILTRSSSEESIRIRKITKNDYSHAILYVGVSSSIESDGLGVQSQNLQRILIENEDDAVVLRLNEPTEGVTTDAIVFARQKVGTEYSTSEARAAARKPTDKAQKPNRQFCTRFVAQAYENAGVKLVDNPDYCDPNDLLTSDKLVQVSDVLRKPNQLEIELAQSENPLDKQAEIHNYIFENARQISGKDVQTFEQLAEVVLDSPEKEPEITQVVKDSGYLTMWELDIKNCPWHYNAEQLIRHYSEPRVIRNVAHFFATTEYETRSRFLYTLEALFYWYHIQKQEYFMIMIQLYRKLIELSHQREDEALKVLNLLYK